MLIAMVDSDHFLADQQLPECIQCWIDANSADSTNKLTVFPDANMFLESWKRRELFDLIIFPVRSDEDGFTLAEEIRRRDKSIPLIGITDEYNTVWDSFRWSFSQYFLVPLEEKKVIACIESASARLMQRGKCIAIDRERLLYIEHENISYIQTTSGLFRVYDKFSDVCIRVALDGLPDYFRRDYMQINDHTYVNRACIMSYCSQRVILDDWKKTVISISHT